MIRLAEEHAVSFERCVEGTGLTHAELADPLTEIEGRQELAVLRNILRALGPGVAFALEAGLRYHVTTHGMWGFGLISSPDVRSALEFAIRYFDLSYSFNRVRFELAGTLVHGYYDSSDNPDDLQAVLVERDLAALITLQRDGLGRVIPTQALQLRAAQPAYARALESLFGVTPQYNAQVNRISVEAKHLNDSGPLADDVGLRIGEQQCRALLERRNANAGITGEVRRRILRNAGKIPDMKAVAAELGVSTRTLRNQLARESSSYRKLVEDVRLSLAEELLATGVSVDAIADRLGYSDASSFSAAFKRWRGVAPRTYRPRSRR